MASAICDLEHGVLQLDDFGDDSLEWAVTYGNMGISHDDYTRVMEACARGGWDGYHEELVMREIADAILDGKSKAVKISSWQYFRRYFMPRL